MTNLSPIERKSLEWVGRAYDELILLPKPVQRLVGYALDIAQAGGKPENVKPLKGFKGAGVLEVVENYDGDTYRAVYTVQFSNIIYVLHCFQKKSKTGIETPKQTIDLIHQRMRIAEQVSKQKTEFRNDRVK